MKIRKAQAGDIDAIALLADQKRKQYETYQPLFHKVNGNALDNHKAFLKDCLLKEHILILVNEVDNRINGFVIGAIVHPPPVYDPGGKICLVDDFMVERPELWASVGKNLLDQVSQMAKGKGAVLTNVVCGPLDQPKKILLLGQSFNIASEWHVKKVE